MVKLYPLRNDVAESVDIAAGRGSYLHTHDHRVGTSLKKEISLLHLSMSKNLLLMNILNIPLPRTLPQDKALSVLSLPRSRAKFLRLEKLMEDHRHPWTMIQFAEYVRTCGGYVASLELLRMVSSTTDLPLLSIGTDWAFIEI